MKWLIRSCCAILVIGVTWFGSLAVAGNLPRSEPEAQGVSSANLLAFVEAADQQLDGMHSLMVVPHGQVIAEGWWSPYAAAHNHVLYSLSKSFTSTAVGFAVAEDHWGTGLFMEAAHLILDFTFRELRIHRLEAAPT